MLSKVFSIHYREIIEGNVNEAQPWSFLQIYIFILYIYITLSDALITITG